jgi:maleylpyruvate isomerase
MLKLYDYFRSSASFRVRIALNLKALPYEEIPVHLLNQGGEHLLPAYGKINPHALVPALQDGDKVITQSLAIIEYLNDTHPTPPLLPSDPYLKAATRSFALAIAAEIHPLNNLRVLKYLTDTLGLSEDVKNQWYHHWITKGLNALEKQLISLNTASDYCFGDTPSLADVFLIPQVCNAYRFNCDTSGYPTLTRIYNHCKEQQAFIKAWPKETT